MGLRSLLAIRNSESGSVSVLTAFFATTMLSLSALTVDIGAAFLKKRQLQAATDAAAMAAAQNPANASSIISQMLTTNGFSNATVVSLTTGQYYANISLPLNSRYVAGAANPDAVAVTTSVLTPLSLAQTILNQKSLTVTASSKAMQLNEAGIIAGSGLVSINNGLANAVLGSMLGTSVSLTAVQYQGLVNSNINAIDFINALATNLNITAGTYNQVLSSTVSVSNVLAAEITALQQNGSLTYDQANALSGLQTLRASLTGSPSINLSSLLSASVWQNATVGSLTHSSAVQSNLNLYDLVTFGAQIANGSNLVSTGAAMNILGLSVTAQMTGLEPAQSAYFAIGATGTTVHTAQVRLLLKVSLTLPALLGGGGINLPVYIEVANGTASVTGINCSTSPLTDTTVSVGAISGVSNTYIGDVTTNAMKDFTQSVTVVPTTLVSVPLLVKVKGSAEVDVQGNTQNLTFNETQIQNLTAQTVTSTNMISNLLGSLVNTFSSSLTINILGGTLNAGLVTTSLQGVLAPVVSSLDSVVDQVLRTMGIRVGYLDVTVNGARCGVSNLVQ